MVLQLGIYVLYFHFNLILLFSVRGGGGGWWWLFEYERVPSNVSDEFDHISFYFLIFFISNKLY